MELLSVIKRPYHWGDSISTFKTYYNTIYIYPLTVSAALKLDMICIDYSRLFSLIKTFSMKPMKMVISVCHVKYFTTSKT